MLQQKITMEGAETAYKKYLSEFNKLAKLRLAGAYFDENDTSFYLVARTNTQPNEYYYRKKIVFKTLSVETSWAWTSWEKIELSIEASQVSMLRYLGKTFLFWTDVQRKEGNRFQGRRFKKHPVCFQDISEIFLAE